MQISYLDIANLIIFRDDIFELSLPIKYAIRVVEILKKAKELYPEIEKIRESVLEKTDAKNAKDEEKLKKANELFNLALSEKVDLDFEQIPINELSHTYIPVWLAEKTTWLWK